MSAPQKFRRVPTVVEAMKLEGNAEQVLSWIVEHGQPSGDSGVSWELDDFGFIYIETAAGTLAARQGDYIVRYANGEFRPCPWETFVAEYEEIAV